MRGAASSASIGRRQAHNWQAARLVSLKPGEPLPQGADGRLTRRLPRQYPHPPRGRTFLLLSALGSNRVCRSATPARS